MVGRSNTTGLRPTYYKINRANSQIRLTDIRIPLGTAHFIARGWDRALKQGMKFDQLSNLGQIRVQNGKFTAEGTAGRDLTGQMIGAAFSYDAAGNEIGTPAVVPLGNYKVMDRVEHIKSVIEIIPSQTNTKKLTVVEARRDTQGLLEDQSKFIYTLTQAGTQEVRNNIFDLRWITNVKVSAHEVEIEYQPAGTTRPLSLKLPEFCFRDNEGNALLKNKKSGMAKTSDLYQSEFYTQETERFQPEVDEYHGNLRLMVHKVRTYEIDRPAEVKTPEGGSVKIFPSAADSAVKVNGEWVPITTAEQISAKHVELVDANLSQIEEGIIKSAIGPQTRFGESNNISSEYVRDPYFYGLTIFALQKTLDKWGENFAINRAKSIRAGRGIQSGRTHVMPFELLFNEFSDVMETNNPYFRKLSNFAEEIWGPGVSEDTQMEMAYWLKGVRMWVVKEMVSLMAAEKEWGRYDTQNTKRYNYSEVLFNIPSFLSKLDIFEARLLGKKPVMFNFAEMSEIMAGKTWYKYPFAKITELAAIPAYLGTMGHVLFYPVDLAYFIGSWLFRTVASSINYCQHLVSMGYGKGWGLITGLWKNPAAELTMLGGYWKGAISQFVKRNQYGTFMLTVGGTGQVIPNSYRYWVKAFAGATIGSVLFTAGALVFGGLGSWLLLPLGLAALPSGLSLLARGLNHHGGWKKAATVAGGAAALGGAGLMTAFGIPVMAANWLSLAVIANVGFGIYASGLLSKAILDMRRATKEKEDPVHMKVFDTDKLGNKDMAKVTPLTKAHFKQLAMFRGPLGWLRKYRTVSALRDLGLIDSNDRLKDFAPDKDEFVKTTKNSKYLRRLSTTQIDALFEMLKSRHEIMSGIVAALTKAEYLDSAGNLQDSFNSNRAVFDIVVSLNENLNRLSAKEQDRLFTQLSDFRSLRQEHLAAFEKFKELRENLDWNMVWQSYEGLETIKQDLETILKTINVMTDKGKVIQGAEHPYRMVSHEILDVYRAVEMSLCIKATIDLEQNPRDREAQAMLLKLIRESEEYMVTSTAMQTYRRLQLEKL